MESFSISFTLGKASAAHGANLGHNNREFIANNVDEKQSFENITFKQQGIENAYHQLFDSAVSEYNEHQKRSDRKIENYYQHIRNGKREEVFYEAVVQLGDSDTAHCGSSRGDSAKEMLIEYMNGFQKRNPNLYVFNAVLHMDEASPHLHIDFIPFYTKGRVNGLTKGASMKAALDEQGFTAFGKRQNRLVAWEESERNALETVLQSNGFKRENKNAKYGHLNVEDFKLLKDRRRLEHSLQAILDVSPKETQEDFVRSMKQTIQSYRSQIDALQDERLSPYKSFYYSDADKQAFVQQQLDAQQIPYRETENGFEAQECYVEKIRKLEKEFKAPNNTSAREKLRQDIDLFLMHSKSYDELMERLIAAHYEVKNGKFVAVKPQNGERFIRLKSLGIEYNEIALKNRITARLRYEQQLDAKMKEAKQQDSPCYMTLRTMQFYTVTFQKGVLPMRKKYPAKAYAWTNDAELDTLMLLNKKLNQGETMESIQAAFVEQEQSVAKLVSALDEAQSNLKAYYDLNEKIQIVFEGKASNVFTREQAEQSLRQFPNITRENYRKIDELLEKGKQDVQAANDALEKAQADLKLSSDLLSAIEKIESGVYVQSLIEDERKRREVKYIGNGIRGAGGVFPYAPY